MNRLNLLFNIIALCGLGLLFYWQVFSNDEVVYIDTNVLMQKYKGMKDARLEFEKKAKVWQANSDSLVKDWENELKAYEKERSNMSAKEKELKEQLLRTKQQQYSGYTEAMKQKAQEEEQKMTQTVLNEVNDYIQEYGKEKGYKYILGANGSGNVVYAKQACNITEEVLEGLNKGYGNR